MSDFEYPNQAGPEGSEPTVNLGSEGPRSRDDAEMTAEPTRVVTNESAASASASGRPRTALIIGATAALIIGAGGIATAIASSSGASSTNQSRRQNVELTNRRRSNSAAAAADPNATASDSASTSDTPGGNDAPSTLTAPRAATGTSNPRTTDSKTPTTTGAVPDVSTTTSKAGATTTYKATTTTKSTTTTKATTTTTAPPPPNRRGITSYNRITPGAPHYGPFRSAWQPFVAQSNTITYLAATVGGGSGSTFPIRLTTAGTDGCGTGVIAGGTAGIVQYGESGVDIGDVAVTPGATYYICYNSPNYPTLNSWVTYWWAGGTSISTSDQMQAKVQGYNR